MSDVRQWLVSLGLEQYADAFERNDINWTLLTDVDQETLKDIGISSAGHRLSILRAVQSLGDFPAEAQEAGLTPSRDASQTARQAERRQITVMFCDLVGSTALSERIDPEDYREVLAAYQATAKRTLERYGGYVARYMGDGLLVYYGYPEAHEDDPERAVRAGLDVVSAVGALELKGTAQLQVRVGIATGVVIAGDIIGEGASEERAVLGETPNLAARLQSLAEPGTILVGELTRQRTSGSVRYEDAGLHELKGINRPVPVYRALELTHASRFEASTAEELAPLVGRREELTLLLQRWELARGGEGQVVLLGGEPGIGKSRIIEALVQSANAEALTLLRYQCSPYHGSSAFYPAIQQLEHAAHLVRGDDDGTRHAKLEALVPQQLERRDLTVELLLALLSIESPAGLLSGMAPAARKSETLSAFVRLLSALCEQAPTLIILEDAHWIDPSTLELFSRVVEVASSLPVLLLITHRPHFESPWRDLGHVTHLDLNRLGKRDIADIIQQVARDEGLPGTVVEEILDRSDGVPLFAEELTKNLLEQGPASVSDGGRGSEQEVPGTLQDALNARLDRMGTAKQLAQLGAVLGREFTAELVAAVFERSEDAIAESLASLVASGVIIRRVARSSGAERFEFKHALLRDVAYQSLLKKDRAELHLRVANTLRSRYPATVQRAPEELAHHLTEGGSEAQAVPLWRDAGLLAAKRGGHAEAKAHFSRGLELLDALDNEMSRARLGAELENGMGNLAIGIEGVHSETVRGCFERALTFSELADNEEERLKSLFGLWVHTVNIPDLDEAESHAKRVLTLSEDRNDVGWRLQGHHIAWTNCMLRGDFEDCARHARTGYPLYDRDAHCDHRFLYAGHDPGVCALQIEGIAQCLLGNFERARLCVKDAVSLAEKLGHPFSSVVAQFFAAMVYERLGDDHAVETYAVKAKEIALRHGVQWGPPEALLGWISSQRGDHTSGIAQMRDGLAGGRFVGTQLIRTYQFVLLAEELLSAGRPEEALKEANTALSETSASGAHWWDAELYHTQARALAMLGADEDAVEAGYQRAISIARKQNARLNEARVANSLAKRWLDCGKSEQAQGLLTAVCETIASESDIPALVETRNLLKALH